MDKKTSTDDALNNLDRQRVAEAKQNADAYNKQMLGDVTTRVLGGLAADPGAPIPDALLKEGTTYDPQFRAKAAEWQDALIKNAGTSDPEKMLNLHWSIANGGGMQAISNAMQNGDIRSRSDLDDALKLEQSVENNKDGAKAIFQSQQFKDLETAIEARAYNKNTPDAKLQASLGISDAALGLRFSLMRQVYDWSEAHPGASFGDQQLALGEIGKRVLDQIELRPLAQPIIHQEPGAPPNPYLPSAQAAPPPQGNGAPDPLKVRAWFQALPPDQQNDLLTEAAKAKQNGQDPKAVIEGHYQQATQSPFSPAAPAPASDSNLAQQFGAALHTGASLPQLQAAFLTALHSNQGSPLGRYASAVVQGDPRAARILDFVSAPESNGNYNAWYGHANAAEDLSRVSLNQILGWQEQRLKDGAPSTATGRYQFMLLTLRTLKEQLSLTGTEKFTPLLQDQLAMQLLKRRGYDQWRAGKMSDATFANNLADEWASLPNVRSGRSQYAGDGLNQSLVTPRQVLTTLGGER